MVWLEISQSMERLTPLIISDLFCQWTVLHVRPPCYLNEKLSTVKLHKVNFYSSRCNVWRVSVSITSDGHS